MPNNNMLNEIFPSILSNLGVTNPVNRIEIDGLMDTPGHHWSSPEVKQISAYSGENEYRFVLKTLAEHSKREIDVYKFLTGIEDFPIPGLYYSVYDDKNSEYWMIIERCLERDFPAPEEFWKECGTLLARIHSVFWGKTDNLPPLFHLESRKGKLVDAVGRLYVLLSSLSDGNRNILESELNVSFTELRSCLGEIAKECIPDLPVSDQCLLHGSFRSPEIMWRITPGCFTPLGVDWEACRIGHPAEDLAFGVQNLLPKEEFILFNTFMDTYLKGLAGCEIHPDRENLVSAARREALIKIVDGVIPFLLQTYMKVHKDESYRKWREWLKESLPDTFRYVIDTVTSGGI
ncbi:MAG: aminoglycoside phosphotransferase family protein [Dehalococcoidales bacterium]|nr:MAG: aminoglycoside phosphotransferase family protein [Dehalococcoidales bacterium]